MEEAQILVPRIHKSHLGKEEEEEEVVSLAADEVGVTGKVGDNVEEILETRAKQLHKRETETFSLHSPFLRSTCRRTTMRTQTPKSASSAPRRSSIQPLRLATTAHAISAQSA